MAAVVLLIDDDEALPFVLERAFTKNPLDGQFRIARDGEEGIQYLRREGRYSDELQFPFPSVVLLDLSMPRMNGFEVLQWKRDQMDLKPLPVVVWSSSSLSQDRERSLALGAEDFLLKPMGLDELVRMVRHIAERHQFPGD